MKISSVRVVGFRFLNDVVITLESETTIMVGRNNSGKTSLIEVFYKFLGGDKLTFTIDDFNVNNLENFRKAARLWVEAEAARADGRADDAERLEGEAVNEMPFIQLDVDFEYDDQDSLSPIADLVLDLDPARHDATLSCRFRATRPLETLKAYAQANGRSPQDFVDFFRKRITTHFKREFLAVDKSDPDNVRQLEPTQVRAAIRCDFIYAQMLFDDMSADTGHGLSKGFETYYRAISNPDGTLESLEATLAELAKMLDGEYATLFASIFSDLKVFGADRMPSLQEVKVVADFRANELINGSTKVKYVQSGVDLPEAHNGLGFSKLIYIVLQFVAFFEAYRNRQPLAGAHLLFLEEPEAHLHPQMQTVFIKNVGEFLASKTGWNVQLVVTTHSSHIIGESEFACLRYFDTSSEVLEVKDLNSFRHELEASDTDTLHFLHQYMVFHRCNMFFADKIIMVEGTAERLVLPAMIRKSAPSLAYQYISVVEVGGAYAVKFRRLLEFLGVPSLIITDVDAAEPSGRHRKTRVETGDAITTNVTLRDWLPNEQEISALLTKSDTDKVDGAIRVAYQIPESVGNRTGRSFEEAFILANADSFAQARTLVSDRLFADDAGGRLTAELIREDAYEIADRIDSKSDFAFDILALERWSTPRYIEEGLKWLELPNS